MSAKTLCEWKGDVIDKWDKYVKIVGKPRYACRRCGRVARNEKWLCKPIPLAKDPRRAA